MDVQQRVREAVAPRPKVPRPIVVIGAGSIVHDAHLPAYAKAEFPVASLVDVNRERLEMVARKFDVTHTTTSIAEAVAYAPKDAIFDVTVPAGVLTKVLPEIPEGAAVLIQKPMGETLEEAREILRLCQRKGLTAAVNFQLRWAPNMLMARALHGTGALGELHDMEVKVSSHQPWEIWSFLATAPRLEILYHSIHYVDLVRSWFGNPRGVYAKTVKSPTTPTLAATKSVLIFDYGESLRVHISTDHTQNLSERHQECFAQWEGTQGTMRAQMGVNLDYPKGKPDTFEYMVRGDAEWTEMPPRGNWFPDAFLGSMGSLQAYVQGAAQELPTRVEDAFDTMRVVEAAYRSSERGGTPLPE